MNTLFLRILLCGSIFCTTFCFAQAQSIKADQLLQQGIALSDSSLLDTALLVLDEAATLFQEKFQETNQQTFLLEYYKCQEEIGKVYLKKSLYRQALQIFRSSLKQVDKLVDSPHELLAGFQMGIGMALTRQGQHEQAREALNQALAMRREIHGEDHPEVARVCVNLGNSYSMSGNQSTALEYYEKALRIRFEALGEKHGDVAQSYVALGIPYWILGDYIKAWEYFDRAGKIWEPLYGQAHPNLAMVYHNQALVMTSLGDYNEAIHAYEKALQIRMDLFGEVHETVASNYNNLGGIYLDKGNYIRAEQYYQKALEIKQQLYQADQATIGTAYGNLGTVYYYQGDMLESLYLKERGLSSLIKELGPNHTDVADAYQNMAVIYKEFRDFDRSESYYQKAFNIYDKNFPSQHPHVLHARQNLATLSMEKGDYAKALQLYQEVKSDFITISGPVSSEVAGICYDIGLTYQETGAFDLAKAQFQQALEIYAQTEDATQNAELALLHNALAQCYFESGDCTKPLHHLAEAKRINQSEDANASTSFLDGYSMLQTLSWQAKAIIQCGDDGLKDLKKAEAIVGETVPVYDALMAQFREEGSRFILQQNHVPVFELGIDLLYQLHSRTQDPAYLEQIFELAEKSKYVQLLLAFRKANARKLAGISPELLQAERDLRIDLAFYKKKAFEASSQSEESDDNPLQRWNAILFDLEAQYDSLLNVLESDYPEYYQFRHNQEVISLQEAQSNLPRGTSLVEYFVGKQSLFIIHLSKDQAEVKKIPIEADLAKEIKFIRQDLLGYFAPETDAAALKPSLLSYQSAAYQLHQKLIAPLSDLKPRLVLIPDGSLGYLPFECLLSQIPESYQNYADYPFLLREKTISYAFSATLLQEIKSAKLQSSRNEVIAFAPIFDHLDGSLASITRADYQVPLPYSEVEVQGIASLFKSTIFTRERANRSNFMSEAPHSRIIHLSSHAGINDIDPNYNYIALWDSSLSASDIYNLDLNAEMVVLSACETSIGQLYQGEGIASLARSFSYAGARSMVTSLWEINDERTAEFMQQFYRYLHKGMDKDEALRAAKLDFINREHPYYWAGYIAMGDMQPLTSPFPFHRLWLFGFIGVLLLLLGYFGRFFK